MRAEQRQKQSATNEQLWLCETFATALHAYQAQQLDEACTIFLEILKIHPEDGPSEFFLDHYQKNMNQPPTDTWHHAIQIDGK